MAFCSLCRAGIDDVETDVVEIEAKLDKVRTMLCLEIVVLIKLSNSRNSMRVYVVLLVLYCVSSTMCVVKITHKQSIMRIVGKLKEGCFLIKFTLFG